MKTNTDALLEELQSITYSNLNTAQSFISLPSHVLNGKPSPSAWSILECLEHLNRYSSFYLPAVERHLIKNKDKKAPAFKSGIIGNYLVKMVIPGHSKKMKTFSEMDPAGSHLCNEVLEVFIQNQHQLLKQLDRSKNKDLNATGIAVTFTNLIKLKLGDALRFMVYHNQRHIQQAVNNLDNDTKILR